jgi:hypothetical protein
LAITDISLIFSTTIWFLVTFIGFFNFVVSNRNFLGILKNLKFRRKKVLQTLDLINKLENLNFLLIIIYLILFKWIEKWSKALSLLLRKIS